MLLDLLDYTRYLLRLEFRDMRWWPDDSDALEAAFVRAPLTPTARQRALDAIKPLLLSAEEGITAIVSLSVINRIPQKLPAIGYTGRGRVTWMAQVYGDSAKSATAVARIFRQGNVWHITESGALIMGSTITREAGPMLDGQVEGHWRSVITLESEYAD